MWLLFGGIAIITAILNVSWTVKEKDAKWFRFISLSFTALTVCAFYGLHAQWVTHEDWAALMDVVPITSTRVWICTIASVFINSVSLFQRTRP